MNRVTKSVRAAAVVLTCAATLLLAARQINSRPTTVIPDAPSVTPSVADSELFQRAKVWNAELTFAPAQWTALEPSRHEPTGRPIRATVDWAQGREGERNGWASANGIEYQYVHANLAFDGAVLRDVAVRYKGNASFIEQRSGSPKYSFKIDLNKYVKGQKIAGVTTLNLHADAADPSWMNEALAYWLYQDAGVAAPRTSYVRLWLTVTGQFTRRYAGLYSLVENVDDNFLETHFHSSTGSLLKPVTMQPFSDLGDDWASYNQTYDPKKELSGAAKARIIKFCKFVSHANATEFATRIGEYVDLDQFARYLAVVVWINNWDSILWNGQNYYVFMPAETGRLLFIPWDQDFSFDNYLSQQGRGRAATGDIYRPWPRPVSFLDRMMSVPAFRARYLTHMRELNGMLLRSPRFATQAAELARAIRPAVLDEPLRAERGMTGARRPIDIFDQLVAGQAGAIPYGTARAASVAGQLDQAR